MSLADFQPQRTTIAIKGGSFQVRGLSLDDVVVLLREHLADLDQLFALYQGDVPQELAAVGTAQYAIKLVQEAPGLTSNLIALASDEPDHADKARLLPITVQIEALKAIGMLTFDEVGGAKKFFENLGTLLKGIRPPEAATGSPN